ncbi:hypothetical protein R1sor_024161 [Riccia sorocarpa]|uniref:Uncharacterized protein n=1 Tax=Riccia sorocarpa TaxID=122646 RepID=A0ABD3GSY4_9MARC
MKRGNVINVLMNMMPSPQQSPTPSVSDHWAFLDQVDAPQWVDLAKEAALMGTLGRDDPWFYRSHAHHETSLARVGTTALAVQSTSLREKVRPPTIKKKNSAAVTKSKTSVKAYLGQMKRISIAGLREDRLSSRPRLGASPRAPSRRVQVKSGIPRGRVAVPGSDAGSPVYEPAATPGKRLLPAKLADPSVNGLRPPRSTRTNRGSDLSTGGNDPSATGTDRLASGSDHDPALSDQSLCVYDSPKPALSTPAEDYRHACVMSSSDMTCSSTEPSSTEPSPTLPASLAGVLRSRASALPSRTKGRVARNLNAQSFSRQVRESTIKEDESSGSAESAVGLEVKVKEQEPSRPADPMVESEMEASKSFNVLDRDLPTGESQQIGESTAEITQESTPVSTPSSTPRLKRKSLGSALRLKQDRSGSPSSKKNVLTQEVVLPDKLYGSQATHPILEKLRRSWGSALRVKQRREAEASCASSTCDNVPQNSALVSVQEERSAAASEAPSEASVNFEPTVIPAAAPVELESITSVVEVDSGPAVTFTVDAAVNSVKLETECQGEKSSPPPESSTVQVAKPSRVASAKLSKSKSLGSAESRDRAASVPAKSALTQLQKSKPDVLPKSKKPVSNKELLIRSLPKKSDKENLSLELSEKSMTASLDTDRKRRVPNPLLRTSTPTSSSRPQASGNSTASQQVNLTRRSPSARTPSAASGGKPVAGSRSRSLPSSAGRETETSRKSSEALDRKVSNTAVLRGSTSSVPTFTKQKSDKFIQVQTKEVPCKEKDSTTAAIPPRTGKCSSVSSAPDEASGYSTENERKNRLSVQYEPRIHPAKLIREWESKSGKRYYDLQPGERQKANQEITASKEMQVSKRGSA